MVTWMAYAAGVAGLLAAGAFLLDKVSEQTGWPRRFAWLAGLTLALLVPLFASRPSPTTPTEPLPTADAPTADVAPDTPAGLPSAALIGETTDPGGKPVAAPGPAERAALLLWGSTSLAALLLVCMVLAAAALARRRWDRRQVAGEDIYVSRGFGPALVGVARPAIVIPGWVVRLGNAVVATVVRHEREHARAGDHLALLCAGIVVALMPWNLALWWMFLRLRTAVEIDCDRRVLASGIHPSEYGDLLIDIGAGRPARHPFALAMAGSGSLLERRLKAMRNQEEKARRSVLALLGCLALGAMAAACGMSAPTGILPAVNSVLEEIGPTADEAPDVANAPAEEPPALQGNSDAKAPEDPGVPGADAILAATDQDGRIRIRGVSELPALSLTPDGVARDPLVLVDGTLLDGGLKKLLESEPLDIEGIGYSREPAWFGDFGDIGSRGVVIIRTRGSEGWGFSVPLDRQARQFAVEAGQLDEQARRLNQEARRLARPVAQTRTQTRRLRDTPASEDGGVLIRGINRLPSVQLSARSAARDPLVIVDDVPLVGGLKALLAAKPLDIRTAGYFGDPPRRFAEEFGDAAHRGIVFVNTHHLPSREGR
ncbi:MAG: M56 family metallopeptidase [Gemmatimonadetes bacterium]|nr:M56 family metallopeptidase [Gemmatimonadota bacterium]MYE70406.1 M56 family metallopeptidase [Gemmatimonadota bacterium]